jgi:arabinan endo-1,5-alpha-L-arabinosidase
LPSHPGACLPALLLCAAAWAGPPAAYRNPLPVRLANGELARNCADPSVLRDPRARTPTWYLYCTSDPVSKNERPLEGEQGRWHFHMIAIYRSTDLVGWRYVGDAFAGRPAALAAPASGLWAPEPEFLNGRYYLYFTVTDVADAHSPQTGCARDSAIGVAVADTPAGPWVPAHYPRYGNTIVGTPGATTWLRLDVRRGRGDERYTAYSSRDGRTWGGGGTWVHRLGRDARPGLVAMGGAGRRAVFSRVTVSRLSQ